MNEIKQEIVCFRCKLNFNDSDKKAVCLTVCSHKVCLECVSAVEEQAKAMRCGICRQLYDYGDK